MMTLPKMYPIHLGHAAVNMGPATSGNLSNGEHKMCHHCKNIQNGFNTDTTTTTTTAPGPPVAAIPQAEELHVHRDIGEMRYICMMHMLVNVPDVCLKEEEQSIDFTMQETQALILSPPHELATPNQSFNLALGDYMNVQCHACTGRISIGEDICKLKYGQHIVSGMSGRIFDMIYRRTLHMHNIKMLILDEAKLLNQGFKDQIYDVYCYLPPMMPGHVCSFDMIHRRTLCMCNIKMLILLNQGFKDLMTDPICILVTHDELTL
jgi:hypothetical protein